MTSTAQQQDDFRNKPLYGIPEASRYLLIPPATLRSWTFGRYYPTSTGRRFFRPLLSLPDKHRPFLSFVNLVEAHVLDAIRRHHNIPLHKVRRALDYLQSSAKSLHPLADQGFETDGIDLFVQKYGQLISISESGQTAMRRMLEAHLRRIEHGPTGAPMRLYPFTRKREHDEPRLIMIDPGISFGRPVLTGTGIATSIIAERYKGGESIEDLVNDYERSREEIEEAIRCELRLDAA